MLGGLLGRTQQRKTGACPLTANPRRGALYGAFLGIVAMLILNPFGPVEAVDYVSEIQPVEDIEVFREATRDDSGLTVAYFGAEWCGPCHRFRPTLNAVAEEHGDKATFLRVDVDQMAGLAMEYSIRTLPTTLIFDNGEVVERLSGIVSKDRLANALF